MKRKTIKYIDDKHFSYGNAVLCIDDITDFFIEKNNLATDTVRHFNLGSVSGLYQILEHYNIKKPGSKRGELSVKGCIQKYGAKRAICLQEYKEKSKQTCLNKYGYEYSLQSPEIREKSKYTLIDRYGVDNSCKSKEVRERQKQTLLNKYGVDNYFRYTPFIEKRKQDKYGKEVYSILSNKDLLLNYILSIPSKERTLKKIGEAIGLSIDSQQFYDCLKYIKEYGFLGDKELGIIYGQQNHSFCELEIKKFIESLGFKCSTNRKILNGKEIDIYIEGKNIGIEYDGDYYHSTEKINDKNYHFNKSKLAEEKGIRLIHIYECEWNNSATREKLKSMLKIALGKVDTKIYARNCEIRKITNEEAKSFNNANHLQGHRNAQITYGLFYQGNLVQLMSFSHSNKYEWEIIRGCPASNNIVVGGVSKLFKHFLNEQHPKEVFSYCDFNKFNGKGYEELGMKFIGYTGPDKFYVIAGEKVSRNPYKRVELEKLADFIIYGAGSKKYLWKDKKKLS